MGRFLYLMGISFKSHGLICVPVEMRKNIIQLLSDIFSLCCVLRAGVETSLSEYRLTRKSHFKTLEHSLIDAAVSRGLKTSFMDKCWLFFKSAHFATGKNTFLGFTFFVVRPQRQSRVQLPRPH